MQPVRINTRLLASLTNRGETLCISEQDAPVTVVTYEVCSDYPTLYENYRFNKSYPLSAYLESVGLTEMYPIAFLFSLRTKKDMRGQGFGTRALEELERILTQRGCRLMMGKLAWDGDDLQLKKNLKFYTNRQWKLKRFTEACSNIELNPTLIFKELSTI